MKRHIITISGMPGSGKSSTGNRLAELLEYKRFSSGDFMRAVAQSHGLSLEDLSLTAEKDRTIDEEIDARIREAGKGDKLVIDSRLAYHWIPNSFKVYLKIDPHTAAVRIHDQIHSIGRVGQVTGTVDDIYTNMTRRIASEKMRYAYYYDVDYTNETNFDLVVDTGKHSLEEVTNLIVDAYKKWLAK